MAALAGAEATEDLQAIEARPHDVEDQQVRPPDGRSLQRCLALRDAHARKESIRRRLGARRG